jgi:hypothetical protein
LGLDIVPKELISKFFLFLKPSKQGTTSQVQRVSSSIVEIHYTLDPSIIPL